MITKKRNNAIWQNYTDFAYRGIEGSLESSEETVNLLGKSFMDSGVFIVDDKNRIKSVQLNDLIQLGNDQIANETAIIDSKVETQRAILALRAATNDYILAVVRYAAEVKAQIMDARIFALELSENEITLAEQRAVLADEKADIKIQEIGMRIQLEEIERKHVEIEKLRAELSVAKANTGLVMAEIDVKKAELAVINGRVQKAMAEVDKIKLTVEVAMALADLIVRQIAGVRLEAERADLAAIAEIIAIKLTAALALIDQRIVNVREKTEDEREMLNSLEDLQTAKLDEQQVWLDQATSDASVQEYKEEATDEFLKALREMEELVTEWAIKWIEAANRDKTEIYRQNARDAALTLQATAEGYLKRISRRYSKTNSSLHITKGSHSMISHGCGGGGRTPSPPDDDDWKVDF